MKPKIEKQQNILRKDEDRGWKEMLNITSTNNDSLS